MSLDEGRADYLIENPTVANYYIDGLGYSDIIQKGTTSQDSFLYYGVPKSDQILASILNKAMPLVRFDKMKSIGLQEVPEQQNVKATRLLYMILILGLILSGVVLYLYKLGRELIVQKAKRQLLEEREKLIYMDGLTGLNNRMYFNALEAQINASPEEMVFMMTDLNGLKLINDTYGHQYGDLLLRAYSEALQSVFKNDVIIRMGGDEFLVICTNWNVRNLEDNIEKLEMACLERAISLPDGQTTKPTAAVGWSIRTLDKTVNETISEADQMMYQQKAHLRRRREDWR